MNLSQLESVLNPGVGSAMGGVGGLDSFNLQPDAIEEMKIFSISDLDRPPRALKRGYLQYPVHLQRAGTEGFVRLRVLVTPDGAVKVRGVIKASHPDFIAPARRSAENSKFEPPTVGGEPAAVEFVLPIEFTL
jgi:TonB family protein